MAGNLRSQIEQIKMDLGRGPKTDSAGVPRTGVPIEAELDALWHAIGAIATALDANVELD